MILYRQTQHQLNDIKEKPFKLEKEIQKLFETNLSIIMNIELVKSEFTIKDKRIDTLAFDSQSKAFVIIEYKRDRNSSVVDQGFTYLSLMLQNKADFVLEYNENLKKNLKRNEVEWSQSRVVFVSTSFTDNQREAINFKDLAIELWEIKRFDNDIISIQPIKKTKAAESIKPLMQNNKQLEQVVHEIKEYTESELIQGKSDETIELYERFKGAILNLDDNIEIKPQKLYVAFKKGNSSVCSIEIQKNGLKLFVNLPKGKLEDARNISRDVSMVGHWASGDYEIKVSSDKDLEYIMSLVKQAIV